MRKSISIGTGAAAAGILAHGMVFSVMNQGLVVLSAINWAEPLPISTYRGFFQHAWLVMARLWSYAHGWPSASHIPDGQAYAATVRLLCPLIGFALFWIISRHHVGTNVWKPIIIALLVTALPHFIVAPAVRAWGLHHPWIELTRTLLALFLMVWSVGAIGISKPHAPTSESLATA
jgi:hypothetical protein